MSRHGRVMGHGPSHEPWVGRLVCLGPKRAPRDRINKAASSPASLWIWQGSYRRIYTQLALQAVRIESLQQARQRASAGSPSSALWPPEVDVNYVFHITRLIFSSSNYFKSQGSKYVTPSYRLFENHELTSAIRILGDDILYLA